MTGWEVIISLTGALLLTVLGWQEWRRPNQQRRAARLTATVVAVLSLSLLALPLHLTKKISSPDKKNDITPAPAITGGITACNWPLQITTGKIWEVQGQYHNVTDKVVTLRISGFDTEMDSIQIPAHAQKLFHLQTIPLHQGTAVYRITALSGRDTLEQQPLPLEVVPLTPMAILFLANAPDFENRFLADWLSQQGFAVAMRTLVSKNKYAIRFSNCIPQSLEQLPPALLDKFDVVIADPAAISKDVRTHLENAGIGLIMKGDSVGIHPTPVSLVLNHQSLPPLLCDPALSLHLSDNSIPLVTDSAGHNYVQLSLSGAGKLLHTNITNTYSWLLADRTTAYQQYWSALLEAVARKKVIPEQWSFSPRIPTIHQPVTITLESGAVPTVHTSGAAVYMAQHPFLHNIYTGNCWPQHAGWQMFATGNSMHRVYIYQASDWKMLSSSAKKSLVQTGDNIPTTAMVPVSPWWLIIPFLLAMSFLWVEKKI
ncbi:hypothetical protein CLV51_103204 [Chitinophaga niastensis]|uniref:Uncharacterized protein n=1 Tax=Chitinophaga niastensis TaxID=536980 RepID=A0A2P8HJ30_CHINA|nr:hypothetical protein [Chitinophaga niastensis]PSL46228.1 hypothetical protein CLV51_103204 [Chitinophaga niastensis]